jgi:hypothetical protein
MDEVSLNSGLGFGGDLRIFASPKSTNIERFRTMPVPQVFKPTLSIKENTAPPDCDTNI